VVAQQLQELGPKYEIVFQDPIHNETVLRNKKVLPKAWLVSQAIVESNPELRMKFISTSPMFDPSITALVETPPRLPLCGGIAGDASVNRYESNNISVEVRVVNNALLVLGEKYYRWWTAEIDGKRADIVPVNHILRGVYLTPGTHKVEFRFDPLPFKIGKYLTLTSFVLFAGMLLREWRGRRVKGER
jgi:hypothetical protein